MGIIARIYAYLYHLILALYIFGISVVALMSHNTLNMPYLPWSGKSLTSWLTGGAVIALLSIILAVTGIFRYLFPLWAFVVLALMVRGFLLQSYSFDGRSEFNQIMLIILGALLAFLASLTLFGRRSSVRVRR